MSFVSPSQIAEFIDPRAFSVKRTTARGLTEIETNQKPITTSDANSSLSLLLGAQQRMDQLRTNLQGLLDLSLEGAQGNLRDSKYDEIYGKLRSLTAGYDQVLDASTFKGEPLFDGRSWEINNGSQRASVEIPSLYLEDENTAFNLISRSAGATVDVSYDPATRIRNSFSGLVGLDISDSIGIERSDGLPELKDGKYRLEIEYNGPDSRLILSDEFGGKIETLTGVDLTGTGIESIDFKAGIRVEIDKLQSSQNFDKWDYLNDGPVSLFADLNYERVSWHSLVGDDRNPESTAEAEWSFKAPRKYTSPAVNFLEIENNGVSALTGELPGGNYKLTVKYNGANSILEVRDAFGRMRQRIDKLDLSADGKHSIDTGVGVRFTFENRGYGTNKTTVNANFDYTPVSANDARDFDFLAFGQRVVGAIELLDEQLLTVDSQIASIQELVRLQRGQAGGPNGGAVSLLSSAGGNSGIFGLLSSAGVQSRLSVSGAQLFANINGAISAQGGTQTVLSFLA